MGPIGYSIAKRLGFDATRACLLSTALLLTPAAGYIALHEFHPEALAAPLLLLMFHARLSNSKGRHCLWFTAVLSCKENMALLLIAYCAMQCVVERRRKWAELRSWYLWPMAAAIGWFFVCTNLITPALNSGNIDYLTLYDRLGKSSGDILRNVIVDPQLIGTALFRALTHGNLLWGVLLPWLFLPLLRPRWLFVGAPILFQHLLSWRSSEWTIYFHYAAPLLAVFWMAAAEGLACSGWWKRRTLIATGVPWLLIVACVISQIWFGPAPPMASTTVNWFAGRSDRARKNAFLAQIPAHASVVAPFPYLSHLAMREKLFSLHYILKGLKTLSRQPYQPPDPTDFVFIDYADSATFDASSGFYHPAMKTVDGRVIPSSDRLLHDFLKRAQWRSDARNELTLLQKKAPTDDRPELSAETEALFAIAAHTKLVSVQKSGNFSSQSGPFAIQMNWKFEGEREVFPWMLLRLTGTGGSAIFTRGLCAPEAVKGSYAETWHISERKRLPAGEYTMEALFLDNSKRAWFEVTGGSDLEATLLSPPVALGQIKVQEK
jgi:hypothetical protein